ncbi:RHS repeat domain-containing protein, partial [Photorhabdus bodei]|uniref:RHS repeat domain-containing protein n=1 Tax=Photorhabdus bodei TaxID=2029681 RepID=UPI0023D7DF67
AIIGYDYLWSGEQLIEETPVYADGTVGYEQSIHWLYEPGALTPSARFEKGQLYYVVSDHQGTVREILTEDGELIWAGRLLTWGEPECWPVLTVNDPRNLTCHLRFCGQYEDTESGLFYNRHRYYESDTGQYLSPDPLNLRGGVSPYSYVHNPANWIDPFGLTGCPGNKGEPPHPYQGVRDASEYLQSMGVGRSQRKQIIDSFELSGMSVHKAGDSLYGARFHDFGKRARPEGQYVFETFTPQTNRSGLALPPDWNGMTGIQQFQIKPGTTIIKGKAAPQYDFGPQYTGGAEQIFVLEPWKYGSLMK